MTREELLEVVYRFYPRDLLPIARRHVPPGERYYDDTEEHQRMVEAACRGRAEYARWKGLLARLEQYSWQNESMHLLSGGTDPAYSARIWMTDDRPISFHVSLLGPYYGVHLTGAPDEERVAIEVAREIEAAYPGYRTVPPELGNEVLPDIAMDGARFGEATIYICLFSPVWTWVP